MEPSTANIRRFLVDAFNAEELKSLCFDYFRDVYDDFAAGMTKGQMIQLLIERCVRREAIPSLQAALRAERADQYEKRFGPPGPAVPPVELPPAGRDPRQVFVSHALVDADFAHRLAGDLESKGWRIWIAPDSIPPGEKWVEAIGRGLDGSGVFLVVLTPAAVGSPWVRKETNAAIDLEVRGQMRFIPLQVEACTVPTLWNDYQHIPFRGRYEDGLRKLLGRLGGVVAPSESAAAQGTLERARPASSPIAVPAVARSAAPIAFDWVTVPAVEFLMGSDKTKDKLAYDNETPQHPLHLPEFRIARVPVTVAQFAQFVQVTGSQIPATLDVQKKANHPVTDISWHDALAFCRWAGVRLPAEAEWEKAASWAEGQRSGAAGGRKLLYPWGDQQPTDKLCNFNMNKGDTTPVGSYPDGASPYGVLDMAGNVLEWTSSLWGKDVSTPEFGYPYDPKDGRENLNAPDSVWRVLRGGSFGDVNRFVRCASRGRLFPVGRHDLIGFRVVSPGF